MSFTTKTTTISFKNFLSDLESRLAETAEEAFGDSEPEPSTPPYNYSISDGLHQITVAVPGFHKSDIKVESTEDQLTITGTPSADFATTERTFVVMELKNNPFKLTFNIDSFVVEAVRMDRGLLTIDCREVEPEASVTSHSID